jgi:hypothetical protein
LHTNFINTTERKKQKREKKNIGRATTMTTTATVNAMQMRITMVKQIGMIDVTLALNARPATAVTVIHPVQDLLSRDPPAQDLDKGDRWIMNTIPMPIKLFVWLFSLLRLKVSDREKRSPV